MAGIGFKLRDSLSREDYSGLLRAYLFSGLIASGPWIISILAMAALAILLNTHVSTDSMSAFSATVTHIYAIGLILAGPVQLVIVRFAADRMNESEKDQVFPSYIAALTIVLPIAACAGAGLFFASGGDLSLPYRFGGLAMLVFTTAVFITASYLTSFQNYRSLLLGFAIGYGTSASAAYFLGRSIGADWALVGFAAGHGVLFLLLFFQFSREFGGRETISWKVLGYFARYPGLAVAGLMYNLGIWIDKILFWNLSEQSFAITGWIHASPEYDMAISLGLLSIVPGMAVFMLKLETDFALAYEEFHQALSGTGTRRDIQRAKARISKALGEGFACLCKVQVVTTVILVLCADQICGWLHMGAVAAGVFQVTLFGACLLVMFLAMLTALFYFDDRRGVLICTGIFFLTNATLSLATLVFGREAWYGFGFVVASAVAVLAATIRVNYSQQRLEQRILTMPQAA
ncbi:MAG: exopolysaccharide Pel transporter PelG [Verrucomicrobiales bacterium]